MSTVPPRIRYRVQLPAPPGKARGPEVLIDGENVVAWVAGFGAALGAYDALNVIDEYTDGRPAPEDTRRVQALQIAHGLGWFTYLYPEPVPAEEA